MKQGTCSTKLFKYFRVTISIGIGQPKLFSILFMILMLAALAPIISTTIFAVDHLSTDSARKTLWQPAFSPLGPHEIKHFALLIDGSKKVNLRSAAIPNQNAQSVFPPEKDLLCG